MGKAVVEVDEPPLHGHALVLELLGRPLGEMELLAEGEHLGYGLFVAKAGDVVEGTAVFRREFRHVGVDERKRRDMVHDPAQDGVHGGLPFRGGWALPVGFGEQFRDPARIDGPAVGVHRDLAVLGKPRHGSGQAHDGRHPEFPGHIGQMSGRAALFRDDGRGHADDRGVAGWGFRGHEHAAPGKAQQVGFPAHHPDRSGRDSGTGRDPAGQQGFAVHAGRRGVGRGRQLHELPALQENDVARGVERPFHVHRRPVHGLQFFGRPGQIQGLLVGDARLTGPSASGFGQAHAFAGQADHLLVLVPDVAFGQHRGLAPAHHEFVRGHGPVHHGLGQAEGAVDTDGVVADIKRVAGVDDPAGGGVHHDHDAHAHGYVLVRDAPVQAVGHGLGAVLAGQDFLVGFEQVVGAHVELGGKLAGKGLAGLVLAQGRAAQRHRHVPAAGFGQLLIGAGDGFGHVVRDLGLGDFVSDLGTQDEQVALVVRAGRLEQAVDLVLEVVGFDVAAVGPGRDGEALGHGQAGPAGDLAEARHLAAHLVGQVPAGPGQGNDELAAAIGFVLAQAVADVALDILDAFVERGVLARGNGV